MKLFLCLRTLSGKAAERFITYSGYSPTPVSLKKLTAFGQSANQSESFKFLRHELPVRLANIMQEIHLLPENLLLTPSVGLVLSWYEQSFRELIDFEKQDLSCDKTWAHFTDSLAKIRNRHTNVVETMAQGVMEMKDRYGSDMSTNNQLQYFLDRFYMSRISIRMLINQHVLLFGPELDRDRHYVGSIDPSCNVIEVVEDAYSNAKFLCEHYYLASPQMELNMVNAQENGKIQLVYVPSHLYHILFEIMKNALRAVMENKAHGDNYPSIRALVALGEEDVVIKISDQGGGIPRSQMDLVFQYTYTTAKHSEGGGGPGGGQGADSGHAPLAGYGYGLPLSRLYAKYFQGDLYLNSIEGYGTDAFIFLKRWAAEADELLPVFNQTSARQYTSTGIPVGDWSNPQHTTGLHTVYTR